MARATVIANWKMNGSLTSNAALGGALAAALKSLLDIDLAVCVPFPYLAQMEQQLSGTPLHLGAQNVNAEAGGAHTGEVSCAMLQDFGCRYVLVGHSERRTLYDESDNTVAQKFKAVVSANMRPVLCVGETLEQRNAGQTTDIITSQIHAVLNEVGMSAFEQALVAYEPVWAIGTGETATPDQAQQVHAHMRALFAFECAEVARSIPLLYGGSVNQDNASTLFAQPDVDGGLIGGASLNAEAFVKICQSAQRKNS